MRQDPAVLDTCRLLCNLYFREFSASPSSTQRTGFSP